MTTTDSELGLGCCGVRDAVVVLCWQTVEVHVIDDDVCFVVKRGGGYWVLEEVSERGSHLQNLLRNVLPGWWSLLLQGKQYPVPCWWQWPADYPSRMGADGWLRD